MGDGFSLKEFAERMDKPMLILKLLQLGEETLSNFTIWMKDIGKVRFTHIVESTWELQLLRVKPTGLE